MGERPTRRSSRRKRAAQDDFKKATISREVASVHGLALYSYLSCEIMFAPNSFASISL
jgi:hypothetical protein